MGVECVVSCAKYSHFSETLPPPLHNTCVFFCRKRKPGRGKKPQTTNPKTKVDKKSEKEKSSKSKPEKPKKGETQETKRKERKKSDTTPAAAETKSSKTGGDMEGSSGGGASDSDSGFKDRQIAAEKSLAGMAADEGLLQSDDDGNTDPNKLTKREYTYIMSPEHSTQNIVQLDLNWLV